MDSSINDLKDALEIIASAAITDRGTPDGYSMANAAQDARWFAYAFDRVNKTLEDGWETVAHFCDAIDTELREVVGQLYSDVSYFASETYQAELTAKGAVDTANEAAGSILDRLGLSSSNQGEGN